MFKGNFIPFYKKAITVPDFLVSLIVIQKDPQILVFQNDFFIIRIKVFRNC